MDTYQDWLEARQNARTANEDLRIEAQNAAKAEAEYYRAKSVMVAHLQARGEPATLIQQKVKGLEPVATKLYEYRLAEGLLAAAKHANQLYNNEEAHTYDLHKRCIAGDSERY